MRTLVGLAPRRPQVKAAPLDAETLMVTASSSAIVEVNRALEALTLHADPGNISEGLEAITNEIASSLLHDILALLVVLDSPVSSSR
jgi:hypothetical protein